MSLSSQSIYPLTFDPVFKDYPWGGRNLATRLGRQLPDGIVAESWEIAAHPNGSSTVNRGPLAGLTLPAVQERLGEALVGSRNRAALAQGRFPLLIKLLDANRWLSVQVHPDDDYGLAHEGEPGKTEMWVVLDAAPDAELIYGFKAGVDRERFAQAVADGNCEAFLHRVKVQPGDVIFVPAGAIHALGPGLIVAEIQQNSDTTYRIYDWGRDRPLHIRQALEVLDFSLVEPGPVVPTVLASNGLQQEVIGHCRYFHTERLHLPQGATFAGHCDGTTFEIWGVTQGKATVHWEGEPLTLSAVAWTLLPARLGEFRVQADTDATLLRVLTPPA
ncbi:class I mannose-6-phosphate isomerase [Litorilinea aerophila]|uniref:Class I mannose-6-phosphate isomerase n=1 Tax=Litorilinea aerophila TaxID=1204385 RepID=A0A540V9G7_9CHLR|nr:type I phosphomannose isomerase catalytic subunit [Litorilinea aerophila]MCC9078714.1 class I mannose-6-phosphate isomerase [Litorilinea aerophila]OUC05175.1 hypothetical protein RY27_28840 [Litorilinea aerophila]GIV78297.1 MAG: putative mannose-6-phosphate isomerase GmuF [Litorilinea sp.]